MGNQMLSQDIIHIEAQTYLRRLNLPYRNLSTNLSYGAGEIALEFKFHNKSAFTKLDSMNLIMSLDDFGSRIIEPMLLQLIKDLGFDYTTEYYKALGYATWD